MRRPWELTHMRQSAPLDSRCSAPRVYVPISLPDTSSSTFAVLQLVGFSSSPSSSPRPLSPSLQPPATALCHTQPPLNTSSQTPIFSQLPTESSITNPPEISPSFLQVSQAAHMHSAINAAAPLPSSCSVSQQSAVNLDGRVPVVPIQIKENVVYTTSSNFKDVVQQLTGASSNDGDLMPPTVKLGTGTTPTPCGKLVPNKVLDALSMKMDANKGFKKTPSKLQERRKAQRSLERLCTDKRLALSTSRLSPSPVTPLASYFKKSCTAITPTASQSSGHSSGVSSPEVSCPESNSSLNTPIAVPYTASISQHFESRECAQALSKLQQYSSINETFGGPALLSLFPESPL